MVEITGIVVISLLLGAFYSLIAVGFTMIFGIGGVLNVAHGSYIAIGGFSVYFLTQNFGINIWIACVGAILIAGLFSAAIYIWPVRLVEDDPIVVVMVALLILFIVEELALIVAGTESKSIPILLNNRTTIAGVTVHNNQLLMFVVSWSILLGHIWFVNQTKWGRAISAVSMDRQGSLLVGINPFYISIITWLLAGILAGLAGVFLGMFQTVSYDMGLAPLLLAFTIVILGGLGSIRGSVIAAHIIAFVETITILMISPRLTSTIPLLILLVVLILKPQGLFGRREIDSQ